MQRSKVMSVIPFDVSRAEELLICPVRQREIFFIREVNQRLPKRIRAGGGALLLTASLAAGQVLAANPAAQTRAAEPAAQARAAEPVERDNEVSTQVQREQRRALAERDRAQA